MQEHIIEEILGKPTRLSPSQTKAVISNSNYIRIVAAAGAGKTETLTRKIVYLLLVENIEPSSIVAFTFTERAAQNMKSRIYQSVEELAPNMLRKLGEMYIGTIHAYAKRLLDDYFGFGNYNVLDENQEIAFLMRYGWDIGINEYNKSYAECCKIFLRTVNMVWDELLDYDELERRAADFYSKLKHYEYLLTNHKLLTFGSMIKNAVENLSKKPEVLSNIKYLMVDEYQDINRAQEELIRLIGNNANVFVVGDPRQSIYQWRGSNEAFFHRFVDRFNAESIIIKENRRSCKIIVDNANKFASRFKEYYEPMEAIRDEQGFISLTEHETPEEEAKWIADSIEELIRRGLNYSDIGVLTRSVNLAAGPLIDILKQRRIPYIVGGKVGLFKRDEAQAVGRIFAWFYNNGFWVDKEEGKITGDDLLITALEHWDSIYRYGLPKGVEDKLRNIKDKISKYDNFTSLYRDVLLALGFKKLIHTDPYDATIIANLGRFNTLLTDYESVNRYGGKAPKWDKDLKGLCWFMNTYATWAYEEQPTDDIHSVNAIQIMTVHQAKGLEWPVVFLFSLVDGRFPSSKVGKELNWCGIPRDMFDVKRYEGSIDDERKLFYVAITRARDALLLSYFKRQKRSKRSRFIDDLDIDLSQSTILPDINIEKKDIPDSMLTLSASEITMYYRCPYMFLLRNVYSYQPGLKEEIDYGNAVHYCLRRAVEEIKNHDIGPITAVIDSVDNEFFMAFVNSDNIVGYKQGARKSLVNYAKSNGEDLRMSSEVEYRIEFPVYNATITGRVDVLSNGDVRDYKTIDYESAINSYKISEFELQIRLYAAGLKGVGREVDKGSIAFLNPDESKIISIDISKEYIEDAIKIAEDMIKSIRNKRFDPKKGEHCNECDMRYICRWQDYERRI